MPLHESLLVNGRLADFVGSGNLAVDDWSGGELVDNSVNMDLNYFALRPGTRHRVSLRATPGTRITIRARAQAWQSLENLNAPRVPIQQDTGPVVGRSLFSLRSSDGVIGGRVSPVASSTAARLLRTTFAPPSGKNMADDTADVSALRIRPDRPIFGGDVFDPDFPDRPPRALPVDVIVKFRDGAEIANERLLGSDENVSSQILETQAIDSNEVIDVVFINPNEVPIICTPCTVGARRQVRTNVVQMPTEMLTRVFNDALASLTPTVIIDAGKARATFKGDVAGHLGLHSLETDLPGSWDEGGATFEPGDLEIMSGEDLYREVLALYLADLGEALRALMATAELSKNQLDELENNYFSLHPDFAAKIGDYLDFSGHQQQQIGFLLKAVKELNKRYPLLMDTSNHDRADIGLAASYQITRTHGSMGPIALELDEVKATAHLLVRQTHRQIEAPHGDLPRDRFMIGAVQPLLNFRLDIGDLDIDIDVPPWLTFVTHGISNLVAFLIEQGGEALFDYLADKAEDEIPLAVHKMFADRSLEIGDLIAKALETVADRDHVFHKAAASRNQLAIATINPDQLKVPHDPQFGQVRSPTQGIETLLPPVQPIDHDDQQIGPPTLMTSTPEDRLNRIEHFIFVMMENRSFDHMLGYLSHPAFGNRTDVDGLERQQGPNPVLGVGIAKSRVLGGDLEGTVATPLPGPKPQFTPNLPHDHVNIMRQINNGEMNGFASEYARKLSRTASINPEGIFNDPERALRFQTKEIVETYHDLSENFLICDRWFSAVPAGTYPNRSCYYSGVTPALDNDGILEDAGYMDQLTLFDILDHKEIDWKVYESDVTFLRTFKRFRLEQQRIRPYSEFGTDPLPRVSFVDPNFTGMPNSKENNDDQPPTDVRLGQAFIADIVNKAKALDQWDKTMIVVTYDEHGGFADHVPPPGAPHSSHPNGAADISLAHPDVEMFGVRVPTFVVSPHVAARSVAHQIFDHATVFKTLLQRFAPEFVNSQIIPERVRRARHLGDVLAERPRVATADVRSPRRPVLAARSRPVARMDFVEPEDREDMTTVLKQLGKPVMQSRFDKRSGLRF